MIWCVEDAASIRDIVLYALDSAGFESRGFEDGLTVNQEEYTVTVDGKRVQLTYKEFELLRIFLLHPGLVYSREQLFAKVWKSDYMGDSRTLDSHIRSIRHKLDDYGKMIETVRNVGYRWEVCYD